MKSYIGLLPFLPLPPAYLEIVTRPMDNSAIYTLVTLVDVRQLHKIVKLN